MRRGLIARSPAELPDAALAARLDALVVTEKSGHRWTREVCATGRE